MGIEKNVVLNLVDNKFKTLPEWKILIQDSFLNNDLKEKYEQLVMSRLERLQG